MKKSVLALAFVIFILATGSLRASARQDQPSKADADAKAIVDQASDLINNRRLDEAISLLTEAAKKFPDSARLHLQLGRAYFNKLITVHDAAAEAKAREEFQKSAQLAPRSAAPYFLLGRIEFVKNQPEKAIAFYEQANKADPSFVRAYEVKWETLLRRDDFEAEIPKIRAEIEKLLERKEDREAMLMIALRGYGIIADPAAKQSVQEKIISEFPKSNAAEETLTEAAFAEKNPAKQSELIEHLLSTFPQNPNAALLLELLFVDRVNQPSAPPAAIIDTGERWIKAATADIGEMSKARSAVITVLADRKIDTARAIAIADETARLIEGIKPDSPLVAGIEPRRIAEAITFASQRVDEAKGLALLRAGKIDDAAAELNESLQAVIKEVEKNGFILWKDADLGELGVLPRALWLAELYEAQGDYKRAAKFLLAAYGDNERANQFIRDRLIVVYEKLGRPKSDVTGDLLSALKRYRSVTEAMGTLSDAERKKILSERIGMPMPDVFVTSFDKKKVRLADFKGKVVVLNYWATWCGPCIAEMAHLQKLVDKYKSNSDLVILAISIDESRAPVRQFLETNGYKIPAAYDSDSGRALQIEGVPTTVIIDRNGVIQFRDVGLIGDGKKYLDLMSLRIDALLGEGAGPSKSSENKKR